MAKLRIACGARGRRSATRSWSQTLVLTELAAVALATAALVLTSPRCCRSSGGAPEGGGVFAALRQEQATRSGARCCRFEPKLRSGLFVHPF
jgi:hypothetical protein